MASPPFYQLALHNFITETREKILGVSKFKNINFNVVASRVFGGEAISRKVGIASGRTPSQQL